MRAWRQRSVRRFLESTPHFPKWIMRGLVLGGMLALLLPVKAIAKPFAYVADSFNVSVIDTDTDSVTGAVSLGYPFSAWDVAITPDGTKAYVTIGGYPSSIDSSVFVIDTAANTIIDTVALGGNAFGIAITPDGSKAYVAHTIDVVPTYVSVIDTATNTVTATITVGNNPQGVAITPDGTKVYVANSITNDVSVINTSTDTVTATVPVGSYPWGVAITPDGTKAYVTNVSSQTVSVINTATNTVIATVSGLSGNPRGIAITPDGAKAYVAMDTAVNVISTTTNTVTGTVTAGSAPWDVAITPDGTKAYVTNSSSVSVINTATNAVTTVSGYLIGPKGIAISPGGPVEPKPKLCVSTDSLNFGSVAVGDNKNMTFQVTNCGEKGSLLSGEATISSASSPSFKMVAGSLFNLTAGASQTVTVKFAPTSTGTFFGSVDITSNGGDATVSLVGVGEEGPVCPATVALEEDSQKETKLGVLYDFRDEVLAKTPTGQRYIELFYKHAEEGVWLMLSYPELLSHTYTLLERFLPALRAVVAGREVTVTAADLADIEALLEAFAAQGSPELQADLRAIQEELWQGALLEQSGIVVR